MSDHRFDSVAIPVAATKNRELRVRLADSWSTFDLAIFRDPRAPRADASVGLTRDGVEALIHALEAALDETDQRREQWLETPEGQDWWERHAQAA